MRSELGSKHPKMVMRVTKCTRGDSSTVYLEDIGVRNVSRFATNANGSVVVSAHLLCADDIYNVDIDQYTSRCQFRCEFAPTPHDVRLEWSVWRATREITEGRPAARREPFGEFATDEGRMLSASLPPSVLHYFPTSARVHSGLLELQCCPHPVRSHDLLHKDSGGVNERLRLFRNRFDQSRGDETSSLAKREICLLPRTLELRLVRAALQRGTLPENTCTTLVVRDRSEACRRAA